MTETSPRSCRIKTTKTRSEMVSAAPMEARSATSARSRRNGCEARLMGTLNFMRRTAPKARASQRFQKTPYRGEKKAEVPKKHETLLQARLRVFASWRQSHRATGALRAAKTRLPQKQTFDEEL